jgi:hypothetical protein
METALTIVYSCYRFFLKAILTRFHQSLQELGRWIQLNQGLPLSLAGMFAPVPGMEPNIPNWIHLRADVKRFRGC